MGPHDALLIIDVQNDFCPGGKLGISDADQVIPVLNRWIEKAKQGGSLIVASRDWHPQGHASFQAQGGPWPEHCVQGTQGAAFHPELKLPPSCKVISKGTNTQVDSYSAFDHTELAQLLRSAGVKDVWMGGLALDVCVQATARDGLSHGFRVYILKNATRALNAIESEKGLQDLEKKGAIVITE